MLNIARIRADWAAERQFPPSSSRPVLTYEYDAHERVMVPDTVDVSRIGKTLSGKMQRVLQRSYGSDMPVQRALSRLEAWCYRRHVRPREPLHEERGFICSRLTFKVVTFSNGTGEHGTEEAWLPELRSNWYRRIIRSAAFDEELDYDEAAEFIAGGLVQMQQWMDEWAAHAA